VTSLRFDPPSRRYAGYIFDCDGTLADTMPLHFRAWREALNSAGARFEFTWELFMSRAGMSLEKTVLELAGQFDVPLDALLVAEQHRSIYGTLELQVRAVPGVVEFAREVSVFAPVSVASGSIRQNVLSSLAAIGALDLFSVVITPEDVTHGKPDPEMFLLAAQRMGVAPKDCLVLEDGALGIEAARRAGMDYAIVLP
jgi:beta-phosphoglucomutase-like phosphatase (HAD superfamily)